MSSDDFLNNLSYVSSTQLISNGTVTGTWSGTLKTVCQASGLDSSCIGFFWLDGLSSYDLIDSLLSS